MKYIITGGAGFIGSHIAEYLSEKHEVIVVDDLCNGNIDNLKDISVSFENKSITNYSDLKTIFDGADGIFHQAAITSVPRSIRDPVRTNEVNITGTLNVLLAAKEMNVPKVVFASSSSIYGDSIVLPKSENMIPHPLSPYGVTKQTGEEYCSVFSNLFDIKTVSLRYFNVFGPRQNPESEYAAVIPKFITRILKHESPVIYGDGEQTRDFTYVKDVVQANVKAMEKHVEGIFNIAYCQQISLNSLASLIMEITGISVPVIYEPSRPGDIRDSLADIQKAQNLLNYKPEYTVKKGIEETIKWYQNHIQKVSV